MLSDGKDDDHPGDMLFIIKSESMFRIVELVFVGGFVERSMLSCCLVFL